MLKLDIRTKILILLLANYLMFKGFSLLEHFIIATIFTMYVGVVINVKRITTLYAIYLFFTCYEIYAQFIKIPIVDNFLLLSALMFKTLYFPICAGIALIGSSKVSELITFLRKIKLPKNIIIVLAVLYRFFPVLLTDYKLIQNSLKMKGIGITKGYYFLHPWQFLQYVFVPYVIISTNIANELSVSCLCRGIDNDKEPSSFVKLSYSKSDYVVWCLILALCSYTILMR